MKLREEIKELVWKGTNVHPTARKREVLYKATLFEEIEQAFLAAVDRAMPKNCDKLPFAQGIADEYRENLIREIKGDHD